MKFLFIQKSGLPWHGVMSLSAILKQDGVETDLILTDGEKPIPYIRKYNPDFVGFHVISGEHPWVIGLCQAIHKSFHKVKTVVGGPHVTFCPETMTDHADYIVRGEAEESILTLCSNPPSGIMPLSPLVEQLSCLPMPDRTIYYKYAHLAKSTVKQFLTGRGCPYNCSFCLNHLARRLYDGQRWVRRRSPENVIAELLQVKENYGFKTISFSDDTFGLDRNWLSKFLYMYKHEVKSPFMCNVRCDTADRELIGMLKDGGCYGVEMGVESGSERIRRDILNKGTATNQKVRDAGRIVKDYGMILKTFNMIGIPTETLDDCFDTIKLNSEMHPDHASCTFLTPYPKYDISKYFGSQMLNQEGSYLEPPEQVSNQVINLQTFFFVAVKFPRLIRLTRILIKCPPNRIYRLLARFIYGLFMAKCHRLTIGDMVRYGLHIKLTRL